MNKPKSAIEIAREYGVDIEQLRYFRSLTPTQRMRHLQAMARLVVLGRAAMRRKKLKQHG
jgi:hypothetical protein